MKLRFMTALWTLQILASMPLMAQTDAARLTGQWRGLWLGTPIAVTLKVQAPAKNGAPASVSGSLSLGEVKDPLAAKDGPQTVTPTSDITGTVDRKGDVRLSLTFPDLEGRSQPETFTGKMVGAKAAQQDTLILVSSDKKTTLKLTHP
jgi:hypothetical protein